MSTSPGTSARVKYGQDYITVGSGALAQFDGASNQSPMRGFFISADPIVSVPGDLQAYNRYSYAGNRPIMVTDPTGYKWWDPLKVFSQPLHASVTNFDQRALGNASMIYQLNVALARLAVNHPQAYANLSAITSASCLYFAALCQAGAAEFKAGVHSTSTTYAAQIGMETFAKAAMTSMLFYAAGQAVGKPAGTDWAMDSDGDLAAVSNGQYTGNQIAGKVALHMGAGCVSAAMNEGSCGRGAASAGTSALFTGMTTGHIASPLAQGALTVAIGGGASVIGGGKFSDGATVALAGYLFNEMVSKKSGERFKTAGKAYSGAQGLSEDLSKSLNRFEFPEMDLERAATLATILAGPANGMTKGALLAVGFAKDAADLIVQKYAEIASGQMADKLFETAFKNSRMAPLWGLTSELLKARIDDLRAASSSGGGSGLGKCHQCLPRDN
jgi:RHS repeat-associated protein